MNLVSCRLLANILVLFCPLFLKTSVVLVRGHGYLADPPARTSAWRFGFKTPVNHNDNQMWCGGLNAKSAAGGKCGVCGDAYNGTRDAEVGGKWVTKPPTIVRSYGQGSWINVTVMLTVAHKGEFQFRICPATSDEVEVTQECLDANTLDIKGYSDKKFPVGTESRAFHFQLKLPEDLTCKRCVLQWDYTAGNNWNAPPKNQESYRGCADVTIQ